MIPRDTASRRTASRATPSVRLFERGSKSLALTCRARSRLGENRAYVDPIGLVVLLLVPIAVLLNAAIREGDGPRSSLADLFNILLPPW